MYDVGSRKDVPLLAATPGVCAAVSLSLSLSPYFSHHTSYIIHTRNTGIKPQRFASRLPRWAVLVRAPTPVPATPALRAAPVFASGAATLERFAPTGDSLAPPARSA